jgi:PKD repeat protein
LNAVGDQIVKQMSKLSFTASATDVDGNTLTFALGESAPAGVTISSNSGAFSWTPTIDQGPGTYTVTLHVSDGAASDSETINITVSAANTAPLAADDAYVTGKNQPLAVAAQSGVLANDSDVDGDALTATLVGLPEKGKLTFNSDGSFTYTPENEFVGTASFTYLARDGRKESSVARVQIAVTGIPVTGPTQLYIPIICRTRINTYFH